MRTFQSPSGRTWSAELYELPAGVGIQLGKDVIVPRALLRFMSGEVTLDLARFPEDWSARSDTELVSLLRTASVPDFIPLRQPRKTPGHPRAI